MAAARFSGRIDVIAGCMYSGKTTELLRRLRVLSIGGARTLLLKSAMDQRYGGVDEAVSHDGVRHAAIALPKLTAVWDDETLRKAVLGASVVGVDEGQFFPDLVEFAETAANEHGQHVIVAGLDGDFRREPFDQVMQLIPRAESVTRLTASCSACGKSEAAFSRRLVDSRETLLVGGEQTYAAVCRACYFAHEQIPSP